MLWVGWKTAAVIPYPLPEIMQLGEKLKEAVKNTITMFAVDLWWGTGKTPSLSVWNVITAIWKRSWEASDQDKGILGGKSEHEETKIHHTHLTPPDVAQHLNIFSYQ